VTEKFHDPIVAEVRKNREDLFADFDCDMDKLSAYLESKRSEREAMGFRYVTEEERQARLSWSRQRQEAETRRIAVL